MRLRIAATAACFYACFVSPSEAQNRIWTRAANTDNWSDRLNWSPSDSPPVAADFLIIPAIGADPLTVPLGIQRLRGIRTEKPLRLVAGSTSTSLEFSESGLILENTAIIGSVGAGSVALIFDGGTQPLGGRGHIVLNGGGGGWAIVAKNDATVTIAKDIFIESGVQTGRQRIDISGNPSNTGSFVNFGILKAGGELGLDLAFQLGSFINHGIIVSEPNGVVTVNTPVTAAQLGNLLAAGGEVRLASTVTGGLLELNASTGPYTLYQGGRLIDVFVTCSGGIQLEASNINSLGGWERVTLQGSYSYPASTLYAYDRLNLNEAIISIGDGAHGQAGLVFIGRTAILDGLGHLFFHLSSSSSSGLSLSPENTNSYPGSLLTIGDGIELSWSGGGQIGGRFTDMGPEEIHNRGRILVRESLPAGGLFVRTGMAGPPSEGSFVNSGSLLIERDGRISVDAAGAFFRHGAELIIEMTRGRLVSWFSVYGSLDLQGKLLLSYADDFVPTIGERIVLLDAHLLHVGKLQFEVTNPISGIGVVVEQVANRVEVVFGHCEDASISSHPDSINACVGGEASFSIATSGSGELRYQWRKNNITLTDDDRVTGAASAILSINNIVSSDVGSYDCVVSNTCAVVVSESAALYVGSNCANDFNCDGAYNSQDFFDFIRAFFAMESRADFNLDGRINSQDFFDFLAVFFELC